MMGRKVRDPRFVFDASYIPEPNSGCWLWDGAMMPNGYGVIGLRKSHELAHRFSLQIITKQSGAGMFACHKCDNKSCVNPDHLYWGNHTTNMRDAENRMKSANSRKTHCPRGHLYSGTNKAGHRICAECIKERNSQYYAANRIREAAKARARYRSEKTQIRGV